MKKQVLLSLALIFVVVLALGQSPGGYRVVRVVGQVESATLKRPLKTEDVIPEGDQLKFRSRNDYLIIFHPKTGRKRIQGVPDEQPRELNSLITSFLKPDEKSTMTRGTDEEYIEALKNSLQDTVLIVGDGGIPLDPEKISLKPPANIKAEYKPGAKKNNVVIAVLKGNVLYLDKKTLFPTAMEETPEVLLLYFQVNSSNPLDAEDFLGHFVPKYADDAALLAEVRAISASLRGSPAEEIEKQISDYLSNVYAPTQPQNLHSWLTTNKLLP